MAVYDEKLLKILNERYFLKDTETGEVIEKTPSEMFARVATFVSGAETTPELKKHWRDEFYWAMNEQMFMPNSPTLMGAGLKKCLSACSVIGKYPDSLEEIYDYLWRAAKLTKHGCGVGQDLSNIRPKGEIIKSSGGQSAGVVNWMHLIQAMAVTTIQGDKARRAANMVSLRFNHPDIEEFIISKKDNDFFSTMNISVVITNEEMEKALNNKEINLEWNGKVYKTVNAGELLNKIAENAHANGEPGILFIDKINSENPFNLQDDNFNGSNEHYIDTTNPLAI